MNQKLAEFEIARREYQSHIVRATAQGFHSNSSFWNQVIEKVYLIRVGKLKKAASSEAKAKSKRTA